MVAMSVLHPHAWILVSTPNILSTNLQKKFIKTALHTMLYLFIYLFIYLFVFVVI